LFSFFSFSSAILLFLFHHHLCGLIFGVLLSLRGDVFG
jgi:hypothetical protein